MQIEKQIFQEKGFCILKNIFNATEVEIMYKDIEKNITACSRELNCSFEDYLKNVSRWVHPSPITQGVYSEIHTRCEKLLVDFWGEAVQFSKMNVISKSAYAHYPVPCHQDIAYSKDNPYEFSVWIAMQDVHLNSGALEFLPESHLEMISPAVDFWTPGFIDHMYLSPQWQQKSTACPIKAGDAIMFSSRIWHRSNANELGINRFAVVTRWSRKTYQPPLEIPDKIFFPFGMWTCGKEATSLLKKGLFNCFHIKSNADILSDIDTWIEKLNTTKTLPFSIDFKKAIKSLQNLSILHRASLFHNGGDAQGIVYPELWRFLLEPLSIWLKPLENKQERIFYECAI